MNLRRQFELFCFRNRNKGIPNLMMYMALGSAVVYLICMVSNSNNLYYLLCFDRAAILQGQIWRLFTYAFTYRTNNFLFTVLSLYVLYSLGRAAEISTGTFKFNLYYFTGIILQDIFSMIIGTPATISDLNYTMLLVFATQHPDFKVHLYFVIPIKAWILVLVDFAITAYNIYVLRSWFPHNLFPLVAIVNYLLFFGRDAINLVPLSWRIRSSKKKPQKQTVTFTRPEPGPYAPKNPQPYLHRCTVCGRTDVSNPELEFRYCSRCSGYHCYCEDHINNHQHIE